MRHCTQAARDETSPMRTNPVAHTLSWPWRALFGFLGAALLTLALVSQGFASILFLLTARYQTLLGREDVAGFARELEQFGVYDLPCGGGFLTDPEKASRWLRLGYGRERAASRCQNLLSQGPLASDQERLRVALACDVLYRLGDATTVEELRRLRGGLLRLQPSSGGATSGDSKVQTRLKYAESLIAGLCQRLGLEIPDGIPPLDEDQIRYWFY
jgi:hypothetical protein